MEKTAVLGLGSMAIAMALVLERNGHMVTMWGRSPEKCKELAETRKSHEYLPQATLPGSVKITHELSEAANADITVFAIPTQNVREVAAAISPYLVKGQLLLNTAKGIEEGTLLRVSEILTELIPQCENIAFAGPGHAEEIALSLPTAYVAAHEDEAVAKRIQDLFMSDNFRVYTQADVIGAELGGAVKNVIALAAGISDGMGCGDNLKAALITRGLHEIALLGEAMGAKALTFAGLTGIGDLIVTCTSMHSRNRRCGMLLGQGKSLAEALDEVHTVVEGVKTARSALALSKKYGVEMPIVTEINNTLFHGKEPRQAVLDLMTRDKTVEQRFI